VPFAVTNFFLLFDGIAARSSLAGDTGAGENVAHIAYGGLAGKGRDLRRGYHEPPAPLDLAPAGIAVSPPEAM
jgi:hypothetical protein